MIERRWWVLALAGAACVTTSSLKNYSVDYDLVAPEGEVKALNRAVRNAFASEDAGFVRPVRVVLDAMPSQLVSKDKAVVAAPDAGVVLLGVVDVMALWSIPVDDAQVLPALERAAAAAGADLAFCPRADRLRPHVWTCHLVRMPLPEVGSGPDAGPGSPGEPAPL